jgi:hypothetical protein
MIAHARLKAHLKLQHARNHDDRLWPVSVLKQSEFESYRTVYEQPAVKTFLILNDPVPRPFLPIKKSGEFEQPREGGSPLTIALLL